MIKYVDLLYSIAKILDDNFPKSTIRIDKKKSENEIKNGLFYIILSPLKSSTAFNLRKKLINVYVEFIEDNKTQESSLNKIQNLEELFDENLCVGNRNLAILNKEIKDTEDNITLMFTLNYFDNKSEKIEEKPDNAYEALMEILKLNIKND